MKIILVLCWMAPGVALLWIAWCEWTWHRWESKRRALIGAVKREKT